MREITAGLWRWSAPHPDWRESDSGSWPQNVGCVLYVAPATATFFDPLLPSDTDSFWRRADELVGSRSVSVLTTLRWHARSREAFVARYSASTSRAKRSLPAGVIAFPIRGAGETIFWLPGARTLIPGDRIIGDGDGGLRLCPQSWFTYLPSKISVAELGNRLSPLLELPVERVLVSHGEPVLQGARKALDSAVRCT